MYDEIIKTYASVLRIDEKMIEAIIYVESNFNPWAIRVERGFWTRYLTGIKDLFFRTPEKDEKWLTCPDLTSASYGLMQIMLTTAMELGFRFQYPTELLDPATNIKYGCRLLRKHYDQYGKWEDAVSAYNQGNNRKNKDDFFVNQGYVDKVMRRFKEES